MEWLLADRPSTLFEGVALFGTALALALGSIARTRALTAANSVVAVFWTDASRTAWTWAAATGTTLAGALLEIEGLAMPIWLLVETVTGVALPVLLRHRWRSTGMEIAARVPAAPVGTRPRRVVGTTWEAGLLGAAVAGMGAYLITMAHVWGHPIHWIVAGIGAALGFAVGIAAATPRYSVRGPAGG